AVDPFKVGAPSSAAETAAPQEALELLVGPNAEIALDGEVMTESEMLAAVTFRVSAQPNLRLQLKADAGLAANRVVLLMESLREHGVEKLFLVTLPPST
ncbi:MAG: biopolymer transporter ExbD, partial [Myxococcota bacterium]